MPLTFCLPVCLSVCPHGTLSVALCVLCFRDSLRSIRYTETVWEFIATEVAGLSHTHGRFGDNFQFYLFIKLMNQHRYVYSEITQQNSTT